MKKGKEDKSTFPTNQPSDFHLVGLNNEDHYVPIPEHLKEKVDTVV